MTKVLIISPPYSGHLNPLITIAYGLQAANFEVVFATGPTKTTFLADLGFTAYAVLPNDRELFSYIVNQPTTSPMGISRHLINAAKLVPQLRKELDEIAEREKPDLIMADFMAPIASLISKKYDIPWVTTIPTPLALESKTGTPSYLGGWLPPKTMLGRTRDALGRTGRQLFKKVVMLGVGPRLRKCGFETKRADGSEAAYSPTAIFGLGLKELEFDKTWPKAFQMVGPLTDTPEKGFEYLAHFIETDRPKVLVTLGTHLDRIKSKSIDELTVLASAFKNVDFYFSYGNAAKRNHAPIKHRDNVMLFNYVPYDLVLPHCAAVIHHGGAGIAYSAIKAGLPALVWPQDFDQFDYAARLVHAGVANRVRNLTSAKTAQCLDWALTGAAAGLPAVQKMQTALLQTTPVDDIVRRVKEIIGG